MIKEDTLAASPPSPTILSPPAVRGLLVELDGLWRVIAQLVYSTGMRPQEVVRLRYRDIDTLACLVRVSDDQGETDRVLRFPAALKDSLSQLQTAVEALYRWDRSRGFGTVSVPLGAHLKTRDAHRQLAWQYYFPHYERFPDGTDGSEFRHHVELYRFEEELSRAAGLVGINRKISGYTLRHTRAVLLLRKGYPAAKVQAILGQSDPTLLDRYRPLITNARTAA